MIDRRIGLLVAVTTLVAMAMGGLASAQEDVGTLGPPLTALPDKIASGDWLVAFIQKPSLLMGPRLTAIRSAPAEGHRSSS